MIWPTEWDDYLPSDNDEELDQNTKIGFMDELENDPTADWHKDSLEDMSMSWSFGAGEDVDEDLGEVGCQCEGCLGLAEKGEAKERLSAGTEDES
jgi:hypothetical protein